MRRRSAVIEASSRAALVIVIDGGNEAAAQHSRAIRVGTGKRPNLPHSQPIPAFFCGASGTGKCLSGQSVSVTRLRRNRVVKILLLTGVIATGATLVAANIAAAADLPQRQPVYQTASVGKMPIGKSPIGKSPIGKTPVAHY
jgi:hypothetical protein